MKLFHVKKFLHKFAVQYCEKKMKNPKMSMENKKKLFDRSIFYKFLNEFSYMVCKNFYKISRKIAKFFSIIFLV